MSVSHEITIREIMLLEIFMLFLAVNFSRGEYREGLGMREDNENSRRDDSGTRFWGLSSRNSTRENGNSNSVIHFPGERHGERNEGRHEEWDHGRHEGKDQGRHDERNEGKHEGWNQGRHEEKNQGRHDERNEGKHEGWNQGRHEEKNQGRQDERNEGKHEGWNQGRHDERNEGKHQGTNAERHEEKKQKNNEGAQKGKQDNNSNQQLLPKDKCGLDVPRRIIGGSTTDIDEFPWLCLLQYVNPSGEVSHDCSGVLISKRYVLTAAHCTHGLGITTRNLKLRKVRLGEWDTSTEKDCQGDVCSSAVQEIEVEDVIPHEKYKPREKAQTNDIALIRLRQEANLNQYVQPICLPFGMIGNTDYEGKKLTVSGWGRTSNARDSASNIKMKVDLPVTSRESCRQFYDSYYGGLKISGSQFCAGGEDGKDSCQGDSGGALMTTERTKDEVKWFVIGIVSSGPAACAVQGRPSLYTNVSQFTDWISNNVKN